MPRNAHNPGKFKPKRGGRTGGGRTLYRELVLDENGIAVDPSSVLVHRWVLAAIAY